MKFKNRRGFTVVELLVYLAVIIGILMINLMLIKVVEAGNPSERIFWNSFDSAWNRMIMNAKAEDIYYRVSIRDTDVTFYPMYARRHAGPIRSEHIKVPGSMHVRSAKTLTATDDGFTAPTTVVWLDQDGQVKYDQKIQMGWSGYRVEKR